MQVSFHLPLHRYLAVFMCQAIRQQGATLRELLPPTDMLHLLMMHPLRVQVSAFFSISINSSWTYNHNLNLTTKAIFQIPLKLKILNFSLNVNTPYKLFAPINVI